MTYETVVPELIDRFPNLRSACQECSMEDDEPLAYVVFARVLIPLLEQVLAERNMSIIRELCEYFEIVAIESGKDGSLADLLGIEIGEWLPSAPNRDILERWLGPETKRVCAYIPRL